MRCSACKLGRIMCWVWLDQATDCPCLLPLRGAAKAMFLLGLEGVVATAACICCLFGPVPRIAGSHVFEVLLRRLQRNHVWVLLQQWYMLGTRTLQCVPAQLDDCRPG